MIFVHPMWDSENERLGMRSCTRLGYALVGLGDLAGTLLGLVALLGSVVYVVYKIASGQFSAGVLWVLSIPLALGVLGRLLFEAGWALARRKRFRYDSARTAWWEEGGEVRSFPQGAGGPR